MHPHKGNLDTSKLPTQQMKGLLTSSIAQDMLNERKFKIVRQNVVQEFMDKNRVDVNKIQDALDSSGVSKRGYSSIFKAVMSTLKSQRIKRVLLPTPTEVWRLRGNLNEQLDAYLGSYVHVQGEYKGANGVILYNEYNNIFVDLKQLQVRMVEFYGMNWEECQGCLKFVIKLDECEVIKEHKWERVTLTLMNRALDSSISEVNPSYFSVQSEKHIWWLGTFMVYYNVGLDLH